MNGKTNQKALVVSLCVTALVGVGLIHLAYISLLPWTKGPDSEVIGSRALADVALQSVQYVQAITMATFGGAVLLLTQGGSSNASVLASAKRRAVAAVGVLFLSLAILAGFVTIEAIIEALEYGVVRAKTDSLRYLRILQSGFLMVGVALVGGALLANLTRSPAEPTA